MEKKFITHQINLPITHEKNREKQQYFHPSQQEDYKEKPSYRKSHINLTILDQFDIEINDQRTLACPLVWSHDKMSITAPEEIKIPTNKTYSQDWVAYNQAQTQEKLLFLELLHELTSNIPDQKHKGNGRPPAQISDMIFSICLKTYLGFSSRRTESDTMIAQQLGYINHVPHFNTILKYLNNPKFKDVLKVLIDVSAMPLRQVEDKIAVDASGFSTTLFDRWMDVRAKRSERRLFKKAHIVCGTRTNVIISVEITDGHTHDSLMFKQLVEHAFENFTIKEVSADMAYSSRENLGVVCKFGSVPFIPFKKNASRKPKGIRIWSIMYDYFKNHREEYMRHYHQRSNVETVFSMIKRKQGINLRTKNDIAQVNEIMCKCLVHNILVLIQEMFEIGIRIDFHEDIMQEFMCKITM